MEEPKKEFGLDPELLAAIQERPEFADVLKLNAYANKIKGKHEQVQVQTGELKLMFRSLG